MKFFAHIFLITILSCNFNRGPEKAITESDNTGTNDADTSYVDTQKRVDSNTEILETFVDSLSIGKKGQFKIELIKHRVYDDNYVIIKFYIRGPNTWYIQNTYSYERNALTEFQPEISDFNNDHFNDITFISGSAARGANEIRRLFIYHNQKQELIPIVNSQDYPNLLYNNELNCIDAFLVYGGCSTVFLNISGDSLKKFAIAELNNGLTVSTFDKYGKEQVILKDNTREEIYIRYKSFKPLKEY